MQIPELKNKDLAVWHDVKNAITQKLIAFHLAEKFKVSSTVDPSGDLAQAVHDISTAPNIEMLTNWQDTATFRKGVINQISGQSYQQAIKSLSLEQKANLLITIKDVLKTARNGISESDPQHVRLGAYINDLNDPEFGMEVKIPLLDLGNFTEEDISATHIRVFLKDYIGSMMNDKIIEFIEDGRFAPNSAFITSLKEFTRKVEALGENSTPADIQAVYQSIDAINKQLQDEGTKARNYNNLFTRGTKLLPRFLVSSVKFAFVMAVVVTAIVGIFVPPVLIATGVLTLVTSIVSAIQKRFFPDRVPTLIANPQELLSKLPPEAGTANPIFSLASKLFFDYVIPAFTDVFKYGTLLFNHAEYSAMEINKFTANTKTMLDYVSQKLFNRPGSSLGKEAAAAPNVPRTTTTISPVVRSSLELRSVSERPSTQDSLGSLRSDSQNSQKSQNSARQIFQRSTTKPIQQPQQSNTPATNRENPDAKPDSQSRPPSGPRPWPSAKK